MRERIQSGGASGGGATSCDQREADLGVRKTDDSLERGGKGWKSSASGGKRLARYSSVVEMTLSGSSPSKSGIGCDTC